MAEQSWSLCVRGLPTHVDPERLTDKLHIHFLRSRNGGGEITSVTFKAEDRCANITFEDRKVALSVLSHCPHILEVDGKKYELFLSLPGQESSILNKVILNMSMSIDCSQLPVGEETVKNLCKKYPGVRVQFIRPHGHCVMNGLYSEIQAVLSDLLELLGDLDPLRSESSVLRRERTAGLDSLEQQGARPANAPCSFRSGGLNLQYQQAKASEVLLEKDPNQECNSMGLSHAQAEERKGWLDEANVEALSLIMEADVFAYLRSRSEEYKHILLSHGVHVVDVTSDGVTTLYLQSDTKFKTGSEAEKHMKQASEQLSQLYQQLERNLRRDQVARSALGRRGANNEAFKELQSLLPKVLLSYDQSNVYIVGESSEVSQAKQILLLGSGHEQGFIPTPKKETSPSLSLSNSSSPTLEATQMASTSSASKTNITHVGDRRGKGGEEYKLAARFRNAETGLPGFYPGERRKREIQDLTTSMNVLALASNSVTAPPLRSSFNITGTSNGDNARCSQANLLRVTGPNRTGEDILFQKMEPLSFANTFKTSGPLLTKVGKTNTIEPAVKAPSSTPLNAFSRLDTHTLSTSRPSSNPQSSLRRANSFSGRPSHKEEVQITGIISTERSNFATWTHERSTSSNISSGELTEDPSSSNVTKVVTVSKIMWNYMKEAYRSRLDALISDLQVTESLSDEGEVKLILSGSEFSKVEECHSKLEKLIDMIISDFCIQELRLADIGVDESSEVFKVCCSNIRSCFRKVLLYHAEDTVFLIGPQMHCSEATTMLKEIHTVSHQGTLDQSQATVLPNQTQVYSNRQIKRHGTKAGTENLKGCSLNQALGHKSQSESWEVSYIQSPKQKLASKEMVKKCVPADVETMQTGKFLSQSSEESEALVGTRDELLNPSSLTKHKKQKNTTTAPKQTNSQVHNQAESCVCGESSAHGTHTSCGMFLCPECFLLHTCARCSKVTPSMQPSEKMSANQLNDEQPPKKNTRKEANKQRKQESRIQGTMTCVELNLSLSGYSRYTTVKIIYNIPDGIQGEEHPNPGSPFQGGIFEAFLPLSPTVQGLLPRLKKAFNQRLTFKISTNNSTRGRGARVIWNQIPHKTKMDGGKSGNGYPDSTYLNDLSEALKACGTDEVALSGKS